MSHLYYQSGAIQHPKKPVFFFQVLFSSDTRDIFRILDFQSAPNLAVLNPKFSMLSQTARKPYLQNFKWTISHSDGHVTTHKLLDFVNKRTGKEVIYRPTLGMMLTTISVFLVVMVFGVVVYTKMRGFWGRWQVWFGGAMVVYVVCVSGVVYDVIHDVPFVGTDESGNPVIFSGEDREQYGAEGLIISLAVSTVGILLILLLNLSKKILSRFIGILMILTVFFLVKSVQSYYGQKGWYNPMFSAPSDYLRGPYTLDQGNNI